MVHEMNCVKGELAIVVRTHPGFSAFLGRIFLCEERGVSARGMPGWKTPWEYKGRDIIAPDHCVRPIRDNPGKDETLDWCPVPTKETA
jgi:hypothetical protein